MNCSSCESKNAVETLKIARGQIDGIIKMIGDERYCIDVSRQIGAVTALLKKANSAILKQHLSTCVTDAILKGEGRDKIDEIMLIIDKYLEK